MKRWAGHAAAGMGLLALCSTVGCGSFFVYPGTQTGSTSSTGDYVYVANGSSTTNSLAGFVVGTGTLTAVTGSPYALGFVPTAVAVNPANTIVFVAGTDGVSGYINSYTIGTGGVLSLTVSNNVGSSGEIALDVSPDGNWLLGLDSNGPTANQAIVDEYQITSSTGQLKAGTGAVYTYTGTSIPTILPRAIKFAPSGAYVFVAVGTAGDLVYSFTTSNGALSTSPLTLSPGSATSSDNALAVNSTSTYLYIARSGTNGGLAVYTIGSGGALSLVSGSPLAAGTQPFSVVVNKAGTDVYVANQTDGTISGYSVASNGAVAVLSPATFSTASPRALAIDNSGNYLLSISNGGNPDLSMYSYSAATIATLSTSSATATDPAGAVAMATTH